MPELTKYLWVKVTDDELELPIAIADSSEELARIVGVTPNSIRAAICNANKYGWKTQYRKVEINDI